MRLLFSIGAALSFALAGAAWSDTLPAPTGEVLLTVTGAIGGGQSDDRAEFDLAMLEGLGTVTIETTTIWTEGDQSFEGVPVARVLAAVKARGVTLKASAINDYSVDIPVAEIDGDFPIIAVRRNGEAMSIRDKGPLWIVYPYDADDAYRTETIYSRSIWQLDRIEVLE